MNCTVMGSCWSTVKKIRDIKYHRYSVIFSAWFKLISQVKSTYAHAGHSGTVQSFLSWILIHLLHLALRQPWRTNICFIKLATNINFYMLCWYSCGNDTSDFNISASRLYLWKIKTQCIYCILLITDHKFFHRLKKSCEIVGLVTEISYRLGRFSSVPVFMI